MPLPTQTNDTLNQAQSLKQEALEILQSASATADDLEKAERIIAQAEGLVSQSNTLKDLRARAQGLITNGQLPEQVETPNPLQKFVFDWGKYLVAVKAASRGVQDERLGTHLLRYISSEIERKDLAESVGSAGGWLVPTELSSGLRSQIEESSIVRRRAMVIPMGRRQIDVPALKQDGTTAGEPHWFGGMTAFWEAEAATLEETEPEFRNITLTAYELTAVTHASNNLLADSAISLAAILTGPRGFPGVIAWKEDYAFLNGTGTGQPLGVLNAPATIAASRTTGGTIKYDDLVAMMNSMLPSANSVWVANLKTRATLMLMNGPSGNPAYLWGSAREGIPDTLLGMPILFTEKVPALGSAGDIGLYDFSHYYVGDRMATTIESTDQARWLRNQTSWKVVHRVDGQPWLNTYFTLADGASTISPFVKLAA